MIIVTVIIIIRRTSTPCICERVVTAGQRVCVFPRIQRTLLDTGPLFLALLFHPIPSHPNHYLNLSPPQSSRRPLGQHDTSSFFFLFLDAIADITYYVLLAADFRETLGGL